MAEREMDILRDRIESLETMVDEWREAAVKAGNEASNLRAECDALKAEVDELCSKVCDECDGSGEYTLTDSTGYMELCPCVCVGETDSYQRLKAERDALDAEVKRLREIGGGSA